MDYILGLSVSSKHQISIQNNIAYAAGQIVVLYSYSLNQQTNFLLGKASVSAVLISKDGTHVFTGEQATKSPCVNIFKLSDEREILPQLSMKGHKFGIQQIIESPVQPYLISLGSEPDKGLFLWDWKTGTKLTVNKLSKPVHSIKFNQNGTILISAGQSHLKYWQFQQDGTVQSIDGMLDPKSFILNEKFQFKTYIDLVVTDKVYTVTFDSLLCIFQLQSKQLEKWMDLRANNAFSLTIQQNNLICGCSDGIIRIFNSNLQHIVTLSKPPNLLNYNIEKGTQKLKSTSHNDQFADCIGVQAYQNYLVVVYSDRTMFLWDISNFQKISVKRSFLNHSGSINDLQILQQQSSIETTFFVTASSDQTLRIWHIYDELPQGIRRNAYCKNLSKIIYIGDQTQQFKYGNLSTFTIRCVRLSKDGDFLACGDSQGILRVYSTQTFQLIKQIQAHEQEILAIDFSDSIDFLASGSRDRSIHIYNENFEKIGTLEEHTSSITHLKFSLNRLISCGLDKSIIFREYNGQKFKIYHQEQMSRVFSMDVSYNHLYVCLEKKIVVFDLFNGKIKQSIETESNSKILLYCKEEKNCQYIATFSDKLITILNNKFEIIQRFQHDHLTSMAFALNNKNFLSAGTDGCIIVWKLNKTFKKKQLGLIGKKLKQVFAQQDLKSSKEWTINSFWIEEELRGFLNHAKDQPQIQNNQEEEIELYKFESDTEEENKKSPKIDCALSPLQDSEFNYKGNNKQFDFIALQQQLKQVQQNMSKINETQTNHVPKYQINKVDIIQEANVNDEQSQVNFFEQQKRQQQNESLFDPTIQSDKLLPYETLALNYENLQTQQTNEQVNQTQDLQTERQNNDQQLIQHKQVEFQVKQQDNQSIVIPNQSELPQYTQYNQEHQLQSSLQINNQSQTKVNQDQLKLLISSEQGISRDSINLNQSYLYENQSQYSKINQENQQKIKERQNQQLVFQKTNLAQYHLRQIKLELEDLSKLITDIPDTNIQTQVLKSIDEDCKQIIGEIEQFRQPKIVIEQSNNSFSQIEPQKLSEEDIKKIVFDCSKDLLDNYSKLILEQLKQKQ